MTLLAAETYSPRQVATMFGMSILTLRQATTNNAIPSTRVRTYLRTYAHDDVVAALEAHNIPWNAEVYSRITVGRLLRVTHPLLGKWAEDGQLPKRTDLNGHPVHTAADILALTDPYDFRLGFCTDKAVRTLLNLTAFQLDQRIADNTIPHIVLPGQIVRFPATVINASAKSR